MKKNTPCRVRDSIGIVGQFEAGEIRIKELIALLEQKESMEIADALEKISHTHLDELHPCKKEIIQIAQTAKKPSTLWHMLQVLGRMTLDETEIEPVQALLLHSFCASQSKIVRVYALQATADLAGRHPVMKDMAASLYKVALNSEVPSLRARARKIDIAE